MKLGVRVRKLEVVAAPIRAEQQRKQRNRELREMLFRDMKAIIESQLALYRYVFGDDLDEEEKTKDIIEIELLYHAEAKDRFGTDENHCYNATLEQLNEISKEVISRFDRHYYRNYQTAERYSKDQEQWQKVREDMAAGVASAESEAAEYIRQLFKRYPRNLNAQRFYDIWE